MKYNEKDIRNAIENGKSMSQVARELNKQVGQISNFCKRHNIKSKFVSNKKVLPLDKIKKEYLAGDSFFKLGKEYNRPAALIKKHLINKYPDLHIRSMDEAKRPPELNDADVLFNLMQELSLTKIGKKLGVKTQTVCNAVARLGLSECVSRQEINIPEDDLKEMYVENQISTTQIAKFYNTWPQTVIRHLNKFKIEVRAAGGTVKPSKYNQLNDEQWLKLKYLSEGLSANEISNIVGCGVSLVLYHLHRHQIPIRSKEKIYSGLRRKQSKSSVISTKWGQFRTSSDAEKLFIESVPTSVKILQREPITLKHKGMQYTPDFKVDNEYVEVKPIGYAKYPGVDRQKFLKQKLIANANGVDVKTWYKGEYYDIEPIADIDCYFCLNWKLMFDSAEEVFEFYSTHGFLPLQYWKDRLLSALNCIDVPEKHKMSATYSNIKVTEFLKHFNPHYWHSKHKGYNAPVDAFQHGNLSILKKAIEITWGFKQKCNIYRLVDTISKHFKDFAQVSIFKPWIARTIYEKYLPDGGVLVDPCMGWGGRLLGTLDNDIKYIGYDLNPNAVDANDNIAKFVGNRWIHQPEILHGDSSKVRYPKSDLVFTSPPYDDTEHYYGLEDQCSDTTPIYENIFKADTKIIALNVPIRHEKKVIKIAKDHDWGLLCIEKMFNKSLMRFKETYEPILIFEKS